MKKLICIPLAFILVNCEVKVKESDATQYRLVENGLLKISCPPETSSCITVEKVTLDEMEFAIFSSTDYRSMAPFAINLTKDKLEIEKLKLEITELTKANRKP